ncbi:MAG: DUF1015 family protein [Verrucomicrobiota bacterium]|nr:DUF1015 family protein [Verrucomicrobiota bacterium]
MRVHPFQALRPPAEIAAELACVPYDTVTTDEARALAEGKPQSYLRVVRPEIDLPAGADPHSDASHRKAAENFAAFRKQGWLLREDKPNFYLCRLKMGRRVRRGIMACVHIEDYEQNVIRKHEKTRPDKEDDRKQHILATNANTEPLILAYRDRAETDALAAEAEKGAPMLDFAAADGVVHTVWRMPDSARVEKAFQSVPTAYIADGHHRAAASARVGAERRAANPKHTGDEEYNRFMVTLFPQSQLLVMPYNRCVEGLNGKTPEQFLAALKGKFKVSAQAEPAPKKPRRVSMYLAGKWRGLSWSPVPGADPVADLDVSYLQDNLLKPALGIADPRRDKRIEFVGGIRGPAELAKRVDSGRAAVAFSMFPVTVEQVMNVCDSGRLMPPKSTWFEPKPRSGLLIHTL